MEVRIPESPLLVYPPGPFPPHGRERAGTVDLGIRLRDLLFRRNLIEGPVRNAFLNRISESARDPHSLLMSMPAIDNLLDTWPLAHMIEDARAKWTEGPDGHSLAVMARASRVVSSVLGYPQVIDGRWPMPDVDWIEQQVGPGPHAVVNRGYRDGAPAMRVVLGASHSGNEPVELPTLLVTHGDELVERIDELVDALEAGDGLAVRFETPRKYDEASNDAMVRIYEASPAQRAFERYGHAGLLAPDAPEWEEMLGKAPKGKMGDVLKRTCDAIVLPTLNEDGRIEAFAAVMWDAPFQPMRLIPGAGELLRLLDGQKSVAEIADGVQVPVDTVRNLYAQLADIGACTKVL